METQGTPSDAAQVAAAAQRAQILVHTRYPDPGPWYPPLAGVWAAAFVAAYALPAIAWAIAAALLTGAGGYWIRHYVARRGVLPSMSTAPTPIKRAFLGFLVAYGVGLAFVVVAYRQVGWWAGALAAGLGFGLVTWDYERRFAVAARKAEAEAGIVPAATPPAAFPTEGV